MTDTISSKEMSLRNLACDITSEIRNQIASQPILNIPLPKYQDENYIGNSGTESLLEIDEELGNMDAEYRKKGLTRGITFGWFKEGLKDQQADSNGLVCEHLSLRNGECPVINPPWQFNELDDVRSNRTYPHFGRVYLTNIYSNYPILTFQPGRSKMNSNFLTFFTKGLGNDHKVLNEYIRDGGHGLGHSIKMALVSIKNTTLGAIEGVLGFLGINFADASKFITFKPAMKLYREMANNLLREFAANLGLMDLTQETTDTSLNFEVVKRHNIDSDDTDYELAKNIKEKIYTGDNQLDQIPPTMSVDEYILGDGVSIDPTAPDNQYEEDSFGDKTVKKLKSVVSSIQDGLTHLSSSYRGTMTRLDVLELIPHIAFTSNQGKIANFFGDIENRSYLPYLCQSNLTISESFSNSTKEHPLMGSINGLAEEAADKKGFGGAQAIINNVSGGKGFENMLNDVLMTFSSKAAGEVVSHTGEIGAIMNGDGKILMPEIWSSSSYSRSYNVDFKFWSPTGDIVSIFENVYIPYLLLMVLAMPLQTGYHSYVSPFVVKVFSKGLFSVDFGMIENLSITRGDGANDRTRTNFPRSIKVSVTVKDLSPTLMLSLGNGAFWKYKRANSGLSEYIATMCNLSIADRIDIGRKFDIFWALQTAKFRDTFSLTNIGYNVGSNFFLKPAVWWNKNKITAGQVMNVNVYQ